MIYREVAAGRARLAQALNIIRDTGGSILCGVIFSKLGKYDAPATERGRANSVESMISFPSVGSGVAAVGTRRLCV